MPGSSSPVSPGALPGLSLHAWALFNGGTGAIVRQSGNVSGVSRSSAGAYVLTLSAAMADTNALLQIHTIGVNASAVAVAANVTSTTTASLNTYNGGASADYTLILAAVYR